MLIGRLDTFGRRIVDVLEGFGLFTRFCLSTLRWMVTDAFKPRRLRLVWPQMYEVGTKSIPIVMLTGAFIGMVLAVELFVQFQNFGQETRLGGIIGLSVVRHLGPVLAAVMLAGRVGGAFAAELGTMNVTEQIDALRVMGAAPVSFLVVPRLMACIIMIPIMTIFSDLVGAAGGWLITVVSYGVTNHDYWTHSASFVEAWDIFSGLIKSLFFGISIGLICCYKGFNCRPGAQGVGQATTEAFVTSFIAIIVLNFFLAKFTKDLYTMLFGYDVFIPFG
jgi:phospholipid/cholesterol/gamma-HCH transport system permease protein